MGRPKLVAIVTGAIALLLGFAYLLIVQLLDFRGEMLPAPTDLSFAGSDRPAVVEAAQTSPICSLIGPDALHPPDQVVLSIALNSLTQVGA